MRILLYINESSSGNWLEQKCSSGGFPYDRVAMAKYIDKNYIPITLEGVVAGNKMEENKVYKVVDMPESCADYDFYYITCGRFSSGDLILRSCKILDVDIHRPWTIVNNDKKKKGEHIKYLGYHKVSSLNYYEADNEEIY